MAQTINAGAEFQALPLEYMIYTPLVSCVKAMSASAQATREFITSMIDKKTGRPIAVNFAVNYKDDAGGSKSTTFDAPLLSIVPVPHLRIDSMDLDFKYSISQTVGETKSLDWGVESEVSGGGNWGFASVKATVKGHVQSKSQEESETNRAGALSIRVHASEAPIPEGLARVLTILANTVQPAGGGGGGGGGGTDQTKQ
jgi:hypothetical protein